MRPPHDDEQDSPNHFPIKPSSYLGMSATQLLESFGSGKHIPGSGAAAALSGLLACKLVVTVATITLRKNEYSEVHAQMRYIRNEIEQTHYPALREAFERDCDVFNQVIVARQKRDKAKEESNRQAANKYQRKERKLLKEATDIPIKIGEECLQVSDYAMSVFDSGFSAVRGDSGAAGSISIAGASTSVFVAYLNLQRFRGSEWAQEAERITNNLRKRIEEAQFELFARVADLRGKDDDVDTSQLTLDFDIPDSNEDS